MTTTGDADRPFALAAPNARTTAIVCALGSAFQERFTAAWRRSTVGRTISTTAERLPEAWADASTARLFAGARHRLGDVASTANVTALATIVLTWIRASWGYRWITTEPEPDVIVVDLRETLALGPVIVAIDRTLQWLLPAAASAVVLNVAERLAAVARRRPIRLASICLAGLVATNVALLAVTGGLDETTLAIALLGGAFAIVGLPVRATLEDLRQHPVTRALVAALEPPEPPEAD